MEHLQEFMLLFRYSPSSETPTLDQLNEMHQQWSTFIGNVAMQGKLVSTHQLGDAGKQIISEEGIKEGIQITNNQMLSGNMLIKAIDLDEALEIAKNCPILLSGGSVEVRDVIPSRH